MDCTAPGRIITGICTLFFPDLGNRVWHRTLIRKNQPALGGSAILGDDLVEQMCRKTIDRCQLPVSHGLNGDIEQIPLTGKFDLIVSASTFQWLAHPRATFAKLAAHLNTNGWLIFSTFGKNNFKELKAVTGQGLEYRSIGELSAWLSSEYDILYTEEQIHTLKFSDPLDILRHVKKTGVNATSLPTAWTKGRLHEFCEDYKIRFLTDGYCPLSYHPLYLVCRKK